MDDKIELNTGGGKAFYTLDELTALHAEAKVAFEKLLADNDILRTKDRTTRVDANDMYYAIHQRDIGTFKFFAQYEISHNVLVDVQNGPYNYATNSYGVASYKHDRVAQKLDDADYQIRRLIKKNKDFLLHAKKGTIKPEDYFIWLTFESWTSPYSSAGGPHDTWVGRVLWKNLKEVCDRCGAEVNPDRIPKHKKTVQCAEASKIREVEARGFKFTSDQSIIRAIKAGLITGEMVPVEYRIFAPVWVIQAAELYAKNPNGYAGMPFDEFIMSMKP